MKNLNELVSLLNNGGMQKTAGYDALSTELQKEAGQPDREAYLDKVAEAGLLAGAAEGVAYAEKLAEALKNAEEEEIGVARPMAPEVGAAQNSPSTSSIPPVGAANALHNPIEPMAPYEAINTAIAGTGAQQIGLSPTEAEYVKQKAQQIVAEATGGVIPTDQVQ